MPGRGHRVRGPQGSPPWSLTYPREGSGWHKAGLASSGSAMDSAGPPVTRGPGWSLAALSQPPPSAPSGTVFSRVQPAAEETPVLHKLAASPLPAQLIICPACQALVFRDRASPRALCIRGALWSQGRVLTLPGSVLPHPLALGQLWGLRLKPTKCLRQGVPRRSWLFTLMAIFTIKSPHALRRGRVSRKITCLS